MIKSHMDDIIENISIQLERLADMLDKDLYIKYGDDYVNATNIKRQGGGAANDNNLS